MTRWQHQGLFRAVVGTVQRWRAHGELWLLGALSQEAPSVQAAGWARGPRSQEAEERVREGQGWGRRRPVQGAAPGLSVPAQGCWGVCSTAWGRLSREQRPLTLGRPALPGTCPRQLTLSHGARSVVSED